MKLADLSIERPVFAVMLIGAIVVLGVVSISRLGIDLWPRVEFPMVVVSTVLEGASPGTVEGEVSMVLEEEISPGNAVAGVAPQQRRHLHDRLAFRRDGLADQIVEAAGRAETQQIPVPRVPIEAPGSSKVTPGVGGAGCGKKRRGAFRAVG